MNTRTRQGIIAVLNAAIVLLELIGISISFRNNGISFCRFYTEDSNLFGLVASAILLIYTVKNLINGTTAIPKWVSVVKYMATCCLTVTIVVVLIVLVPMVGTGGFRIMMLEGSAIYHHFLCPVLALVSFLFFEKEGKLEFKITLVALMPTILYAFVTVLLNAAKLLVGPYPFLLVYEQPIYMSVFWFIAICGGAYFFAWLLWLAKRNVRKEANEYVVSR